MKVYIVKYIILVGLILFSIQIISPGMGAQIVAENSSYWSLKGNASFVNGSLQEAADYYNRSLDMDPGQKVIWYLKGDALFYMGLYNESFRLYPPIQI